MQLIYQYLNKMRGGSRTPIRAPFYEIFWSGLGCFFGIAAVYLVGHLQDLHIEDSLFLVGSFGASAILIYGVPNSPYAQPRNLMGGHIFSAIAGVSCAMLISNPMIAAAAAVALAVIVMHLTRSIHPPGGATALIAVIGGQNIHALGYWYVITPIASGAILMLIVALITNNLSSQRRYPSYWL
ncbi:MAG: HPP family protein [Gammaproteobacteria bacterium]|nr:HPP family protein [Gammaproteobacteria bacterium]